MAEETDSPPLVVILGCTGTGKSKLAIEIAKEIDGEIISADSIQVYKGLDIITNKVTSNEQAVIPHYMINIVEPSEQFSVVQFKAKALPIIDDIIERQKVPIIIGGTNYYIESLLWQNLIEEETQTSKVSTNSQEVENRPQKKDELVQVFTENKSENVSLCKHNDEMDPSPDPLYQKLIEIDPAMARKHHPNDTRKIKRSLQVFEHSGVTHSELITRQQVQQGATTYGGPMRFQNVCVLWLQCDLNILDERLDARVDTMIEQGLVKELVEFHNSWKSGSAKQKLLNTFGIFQSIGFKEFREFLESENPLVQVNSDLFDKCVDSMKRATRRYARKQIKWVTNRFLGRPSTCAPDVYCLDATDLERWQLCVLEKGLNIVHNFMSGEEILEQSLERIDSNVASKHSRYICSVCNKRTIIGDKNWSVHLRSRSHRHYQKKAKRNEMKT